ncbi:MAG: hypothetical protein JXB17_06985 [Bacteroidales bacterium]|nr:hypothetical protein [Bacteroidales bacterium]
MMRLFIFILIFIVGNFDLIGQENNYSLINYIPRAGRPHHETVPYQSDSSIIRIFKETYLDGLIQIYRHFLSDKNIYIVIDNDTLYFDNDQNIINGYKTEYFAEFEYLIVSKYNDKSLLWSKGYYLGNDINIQISSFSFELKSGSILSECRCKSSNKCVDNLTWIQFYDGQNIKRLQLYDEESQIEKDIEFYYNNKVAVIQTYYSYLEHTDSIFNKKGELIYVNKYDTYGNLITQENPFVDGILHELRESEYAWDFFYPFNHCSESLLVGSNF